MVARKKGPARRQAISLTTLTREAGKLSPYQSPRPLKRGACLTMPRPCPFATCRYHLLTEINAWGGLLLLQGTDNPAVLEKMRYTCVLDVADEGPADLKKIAEVFRVTRQAVQVQAERAMSKVRAYLLARGFSENDVLKILDGVREYGREMGVSHERSRRRKRKTPRAD